MRRLALLTFALALPFALVAEQPSTAPTPIAATPATLTALPAGPWISSEFSATVDGTTNIGKTWSVATAQATGHFTSPTQGELRLPAAALSGEPSGLDARMHRALDVTKFPEIVFALDAFAPDADATWQARGRLTLHGTTREITVPVTLISGDDAATLLLTAETALTMSDYGIKPPTFMAMVRPGDAVKITIRWTLTRAP